MWKTNYGTYLQGPRDDHDTTRESPQFFQGSLDSQDALADALLAPNHAPDSSVQLSITRVPDPSLRPLAVHAFRILRFYKVQYLYTSLLRSYLENGEIWDTDIWEIPKYSDSCPLWIAEWRDPEEIIDLLNSPLCGRRTELLHLEHLNPRELLKLQINPYAFMYYNNIDVAASSTRIRPIEGEICREDEGPTNWRVLHTDLEGEKRLPFFYINDFASDSQEAWPQCEIISLNGKEIAIPVAVIDTIMILAKQTERPSEGVAKVYFLLRQLCISTASHEELKHHAPLYPRIRDQAKSSMHTLHSGNSSSLLRVKHHSRFYSPLREDKDQIRLLHLKPCQEPDAHLEAEVITRDIDKAPKFVAISHD